MSAAAPEPNWAIGLYRLNGSNLGSIFNSVSSSSSLEAVSEFVPAARARATPLSFCLESSRALREHWQLPALKIHCVRVPARASDVLLPQLGQIRGSRSSNCEESVILQRHVVSHWVIVALFESPRFLPHFLQTSLKFVLCSGSHLFFWAGWVDVSVSGSGPMIALKNVFCISIIST